jgi:hypothetical protein
LNGAGKKVREPGGRGWILANYELWCQYGVVVPPRATLRQPRHLVRFVGRGGVWLGGAEAACAGAGEEDCGDEAEDRGPLAKRTLPGWPDRAGRHSLRGERNLLTVLMMARAGVSDAHTPALGAAGAA